MMRASLWRLHFLHRWAECRYLAALPSSYPRPLHSHVPQELGLDAMPIFIDMKLDFKKLNERLHACTFLGSFFRLVKLKGVDPRFTVRDLFSLRDGVYVIHAWVYHPDDCDCEYAEGVPHYVVWNAGTRLLNLLPELVVVEERDLGDLDVLFERIAAPPCAVRMKTEESASLWVRRLVIRATEGAELLPYNDLDFLSSLL